VNVSAEIPRCRGRSSSSVIGAHAALAVALLGAPAPPPRGPALQATSASASAPSVLTG